MSFSWMLLRKKKSSSNDLIFFKKYIRKWLEMPIRKYKGPNWSKILNKQKRGKKLFFSTYKINYQNFILLAPIMDFLFKQLNTIVPLQNVVWNIYSHRFFVYTQIHPFLVPPWQWVLILISRALILDFPHELIFIAISYHLLKQCAVYVK